MTPLSRRIPLLLIAAFALALFHPSSLADEKKKPATLTDVAVRLRPDDPFPYVAPGATGKVFYEVTSGANRQLQVRWKVTIHRQRGAPVSMDQALVLEPAKTVTLPMPAQARAGDGVEIPRPGEILGAVE